MPSLTNLQYQNNDIMINIRHLLILAAASTVLYACGGAAAKEGSEPPARQVATVPAVAVDYRALVFASGKLALEEESRLSFKTGGIIRSIAVREGQAVRRGQVLAELDPGDIRPLAQQARLGQQQAEIMVENARLALRLAERDYQNALALYRDSVATLEQLQNAEVQLDNARNQVAAAQKGVSAAGEQLQSAEFNLQHARILAPADGLILKRLAEPNEMTGPGTPVFLFGSREKAKVVRVPLSDKDIIHLRLGNAATLRFDAYPGEAFPGTVSQIASMADPFTSTYEVEITVVPTSKTLLSGFICTAEIATDFTADLLQIPLNALIGAQGMNGQVFVAENGKASKKPVRIFKILSDKLLIETGLEEGEEVIVSGVGYLEEGQIISVK
jgi:membrane fusion protein, multidrug efflux system